MHVLRVIGTTWKERTTGEGTETGTRRRQSPRRGAEQDAGPAAPHRPCLPGSGSFAVSSRFLAPPAQYFSFHQKILSRDSQRTGRANTEVTSLTGRNTDAPKSGEVPSSASSGGRQIPEPRLPARGPPALGLRPFSAVVRTRWAPVCSKKWGRRHAFCCFKH